MRTIGCDYHPGWQQISWVDTLTGETEEKKLDHASGEAEKFYRQVPRPALIGMESTGNCRVLHPCGLQRWALFSGLGSERNCSAYVKKPQAPCHSARLVKAFAFPSRAIAHASRNASRSA